MYAGLSPGAIGVSVKTLEEGISAAKRHGFGGVEVNCSEVADRLEKEGVESLRALFREAEIQPAGWGLPVEWRKGEDVFLEGLAQLPRLAKAVGAIGCGRCSTWVLPGSDERPMEENVEFHYRRFKAIAEVLGEAGCSLGLEFIGPKTLRDIFKYPFIHTLPEMLDLGHRIGPNVGLLLDAFHWYTSGGTVADIEAIQAKDVVYVHVNDAPSGVAVDEQIDGVRCLPGETGVIDIVGFLNALRKISYDGPVTPEPFKKELAELPNDDTRLAAVAASMRQILG